MSAPTAKPFASRGAVRRKGRRALGNNVLPIIAFLVVIALWYVAIAIFQPRPYLLPSPDRVLGVFTSGWPVLGRSLLLTVQAAVVGLSLATLIGVAVSLLLGLSRTLYRAFFPYTVIMQTTPIIAIAPLVMVWFGYGLRGVIIITVIVSLFPIIANTTTGLLSTDPNLVQLFRLYNASPWQLITKLRLPYALPYFFSGLRVAAGLAVIGAIVGEFFVGQGGRQGGLGYYIALSSSQLKTDQVFAATVLCALLGIGFLLLINLFNYAALRHWHASAMKQEA